MSKEFKRTFDLAKVLSVMPGARSSHSPLYYWMMANHDALQAAIKANGPQWPGRLAAMAEVGLTDRTGKPATLRTAQKTWYRVKADKKAIADAAPHAKPGAVPVDFALAPNAALGPVDSNVSGLDSRPPDLTLNPSLKLQKLEARSQKESKQAAGEADAEVEGYDFKYARPGNYEDK